MLVGQFTSGMFGFECFVNGVQGSTVSPITTPPISAFTLAAAKALSSSVAMSRVFICRASLRCYFCLKYAVSDRAAMKAAKKASAKNAN